jgi:dihydroorotate dehydrogenase (NAD+) catalytic subunit
MAVDWRTGKPGLGTVVGGLSGPAIKPVALRMCWEVVRSVDVPVIGIGGITSVEDALEFLVVGARAVQIGTAHYKQPDVVPRVVAALRERMAAAGHRDLGSLVGSLKVA